MSCRPDRGQGWAIVLAGVLSGGLLMAGPANAQRAISVKTNGGTAMAPTDVAGVIPVANWNNYAGVTLTSVTDSTGATFPVSVGPGGTSANMRGFATYADTSTGNQTMMSSQLAPTGSPDAGFTVTGIPYTSYTVYAYWINQVAKGPLPRTLGVTIDGGASHIWLRDNQVATTPVWDGVFRESTATAEAAAVAGNNYVVFRNRTASTMVLVATSAAKSVGLCGFQVVEDTPPVLATTPIVVTPGATGRSATVSHRIAANGGMAVTASGVVFSTAANPTLATGTVVPTNPVVAGGSFTVQLTGLTPGMTYHCRTYATNPLGTTYSTDQTCTMPTAPVLGAASIGTLTANSAQVAGLITSDGGMPVTASGAVVSAAANPTLASGTVLVTSPLVTSGACSVSAVGLAQGTTYHYRVYATNSVGTTYSADQTFTTLAPPTLGNTAIGTVTATTARLACSITANGGAEVTASGVVVGLDAAPALGGQGVLEIVTAPLVTESFFVVQAYGLTPDTTYRYRAFATNSAGTTYSTEGQVRTSPVRVTGIAVNATGTWDSSAGGVWVGPARAPLGKGVRLRIYGGGFSADGTWRVTLGKVGGGHPDIVITDLVRTDTVITTGSAGNAWTVLAPLGDVAAVGLWTVTVSHGAGASATASDTVEIMAPALQSVTLGHDLPFTATEVPHLVSGAGITLTATPRGSNTTGATYRFEVRTQSAGNYIMLRDFGPATFTWTAPATAQAYWLTVLARTADGTQLVRSGDLYIRVSPATLDSVSLTVTGPDAGGYYTLQAAKVGTAVAEYRYVAYVPVDGTGPAYGVPTRYDAFTMLAYSTATSYRWKPSAAVKGKRVLLQVYGRVQGSTANLQRTSAMVACNIPS